MSSEVLRSVLRVETSLIVAERIELRKSRGETGGGPEEEPEGSDTLMDLFRWGAIESMEVYHGG